MFTARVAVDKPRCYVEDRLDATDLIPWQSSKNTVAEVDPCNDERVDKTRCSLVFYIIMQNIFVDIIF